VVTHSPTHHTQKGSARPLLSPHAHFGASSYKKNRTMKIFVVAAVAHYVEFFHDTTKNVEIFTSWKGVLAYKKKMTKADDGWPTCTIFGYETTDDADCEDETLVEELLEKENPPKELWWCEEYNNFSISVFVRDIPPAALSFTQRIKRGGSFKRPFGRGKEKGTRLTKTRKALKRALQIEEGEIADEEIYGADRCVCGGGQTHYGGPYTS